jgi:hypothetical protein
MLKHYVKMAFFNDYITNINMGVIMMKLINFTCILSVVFIIILFVSIIGCSGETTYQIEVKNQLSVSSTVTLDGAQKIVVEVGGNGQFTNVSEGSHLLRAETSGYEPIEESVQVNRDIVWVIEE